MRVTTGPARHAVTVAVAAAITLSLLLLALATLTGTAGPGTDTYQPGSLTEETAPGTGSAQPVPQDDASPVNPWAAGDAAALRELAEIGRAHLANGCP